MSRASEIALAVSEGVFATFTNLVLFSLFWVGASVGKRGSYGAARAFEEAFGEISKTNYATIKRAFYELHKRGLVAESTEKKGTVIFLSKEGKEQLRALLPRYQIDRPFSGEIYMVTYDIPEVKKKVRDRFRRFLKDIGCGQLQKSVWITPFNPTEKISVFVEDHQIASTVIVSSFVKDVTVGREELEKILNQAFELTKLKKRYRAFIKRISKKDKLSGKDYLAFLAILKDDPQLPRKLLPKQWVGERSYRLTVEKGVREI